MNVILIECILPFRMPHPTFPVERYVPYGLDSSIFSGGEDFKSWWASIDGDVVVAVYVPRDRAGQIMTGPNVPNDIQQLCPSFLRHDLHSAADAEDWKIVGPCKRYHGKLGTIPIRMAPHIVASR